MKRRDAIKTLMVASGGLFTFPAWAMNWSSEDIPEYENTFSELELALISSISGTIIPSNGKFGALSVEVDKFLAGLISECYDEEFQADIKKHLKSLNKSADKKLNKSFANGSQAEREKLLLAMHSSGNENKEAFFEFMKSQTIRGFETSKQVLVEYHDYVMMPGFYDGDVDVEA
jgi:hypothetical protein